jgi:hypothetical protein
LEQSAQSQAGGVATVQRYDVTEDLQVGRKHESMRVGTRPAQWAERYSGTVGTGASGWDAPAERSMAMAAYAMTPVTTQRISVR